MAVDVQALFNVLDASEFSEIFYPPRVEPDMSGVRKLKLEVPSIPNRLQVYLPLVGNPQEFVCLLPNQGAIGTYPREKVISCYMQFYSEEWCESWIKGALRYFPEYPVLSVLMIEHAHLPAKQRMLLLLEQPQLSNGDIIFVGW
jgi:hypothetical protein